MDHEKARELYIEMESCDKQIKAVQEQVQRLDQQVMELESLAEAIDELSLKKTGEEILVPISSGIFLAADIKDSKSLFVNVGSDVIVKRTMKQSADMVTGQQKEIESYREELSTQLQILISKATQIQEKMRKLVE